MSRRPYLIYTTETGGLFKFGNRATQEELDEIKRTGRIDVTPPDVDRAEPEFARVSYVALLRVEDDWDFGLGRPR